MHDQLQHINRISKALLAALLLHTILVCCLTPLAIAQDFGRISKSIIHSKEAVKEANNEALAFAEACTYSTRWKEALGWLKKSGVTREAVDWRAHLEMQNKGHQEDTERLKFLITSKTYMSHLKELRYLVSQADAPWSDKAYEILASHFPNDLPLQIKYVVRLMRTNKTNLAAERLETLMKLNPQCYWLYWYKAVLLTKENKFSEAIKVLEQLQASEAPKHYLELPSTGLPWPSPPHLGPAPNEVIVYKAAIFQRQKNFRESANCWKLALQDEPKDFGFLQKAVYCFEAVCDYDSALDLIKAFELKNELDPQTLRLKEELYRKQGNKSELEKCIIKGIQLYPSAFTADKVDLLIAQGKTNQAKVLARKATQKNAVLGGDARLLIMLGRCNEVISNTTYDLCGDNVFETESLKDRQKAYLCLHKKKQAEQDEIILKELATWRHKWD